MRSTTDPHPVRWMRDVEVLLWTTSLGRGSGWVADGAGCGVSSRVFAASVYNGWVDGMAVGNHGLETRLSEMCGKLQKYPH